MKSVISSHIKKNFVDARLLFGISALTSFCVIVGCGSGVTKTAGVTPPTNSNSASTVVQASQATVQVNGTAQFPATENGSPVTGGQWVVLGGSSEGTIDPNGGFHAPASVPSPATVSVEYILAGQASTGTVTVIGAVAAPPTIQSISPNVIQRLTTSIQITGTGFLPTSVVTLNSAPVTTNYVDGQHLAAVIALQNPLNATLQIAVVNQNDTSGSSEP